MARLTFSRETAAWENSTSYFPILDRIAEGTFASLRTEKELFDRFVTLLQDDGHVQNAEALSSFTFALGLRAAAPRIEAHYQYYNTSVQPKMMAAQDAVCPVWVHFDGKQYCSPELERAQQDVDMDDTAGELPFDRILNNDPEVPSSILYADITHPLFGQFHEIVSKTAKEGRTSYRLRYRASALESREPLYVNGYGVELVLKRTDYIVIDDREAAEPTNGENIVSEDTEAASDLKPLTTTELASIGVDAASYITNQEDPFNALLKVSNNFPKYSSVIAGRNATPEFMKEYKSNRAAFLPQGYNVLWINGAQVQPREINAFSLLEHLKRERALISQIRDLGLTADEGIKLLSHEVITQAQVDDEPQRYDWQDDEEGGGVIMWLNDIEKDRRYSSWPPQLQAFLARTYPGQLPTIRRDVHNLIIPVNLADLKDLEMIVETLQSFIKRTVPLRFGLIPVVNNPQSRSQARLAYYLLNTYGLKALFGHMESQLKLGRITNVSKAFDFVAGSNQVREGQQAMSYEEVLASEGLETRLNAVQAYLDRLALSGTTPPVLINGVALPRNDAWLESMSTRVQLDLRQIQQGVLQETFEEDTWLPSYFLFQASKIRNAMIVPEDPKAIKVLDVSTLSKEHEDTFPKLPSYLVSSDTGLSDWAHLMVVADLSSVTGLRLLTEAMEARSSIPGLQIQLLHNPDTSRASTDSVSGETEQPQFWRDLLQHWREHSDTENEIAQAMESCFQSSSFDDSKWLSLGLQDSPRLVQALGLVPGEAGLWLNGRLVGPLGNTNFSANDMSTLVSFERQKRIAPVQAAITELGLTDKIGSPLKLAKITSLVARAQGTDVPEGYFESIPSIRMDRFNVWNGTHTSIQTSTGDDPAIQIVAALDPASEAVQHWVPILKVLSELNGVQIKIYLNPRERLSELPVKRFYRQVLRPAPAFDDDGKLQTPKATFTKVPGDALLTLGMHVPPSWLVAPEECEQDLDNIKLNNLAPGQEIDALYELEHILIEGHSRDTTVGSPPRGAQLLLGTERDPHFADTLIMANLGYFQFKANPGYWHISLQPGRSSKVFTIDSAGSKGYQPQPGDESSAVALLSFQGITLYPRLSRRPGMETEDVLESSSKLGPVGDYASKAASFAQSALSSFGIHTSTSTSSKHADINIFSVASGHLYERMLNIMMLSVMKNTSHTVKFWFIEQFLSPSFKSFLPHLAAHYGFEFEMVTYKWPHWLRAQKEKQREIWGYKILFLDVLFPLSLEKVIFVDADQIVRTDLMELNRIDLHGAPYGFTPMCDSRTEMEGFRFWKQGYWKNYLQGKPYHISALYVVDLKKFRELAAGDRLRQQYHALSADPASLSNLDQDLPNHMQHNLRIHSLPQEWLWCETWCSDGELERARTIDLCNNPLTKEPKLERARRQVPEWNEYDGEVREFARGLKKVGGVEEMMEKETQDGNAGGRVEEGKRRRDEL